MKRGWQTRRGDTQSDLRKLTTSAGAGWASARREARRHLFYFNQVRRFLLAAWDRSIAVEERPQR
jgi:hypothetical protein